MTEPNEEEKGFILIAEDDRGASSLEARQLAPLGLEIRCAFSAKEVLEVLKTASPELMLVDYSLPEMNALELLAELERSNVKAPPFIVVTGQGDEKLAVEVMKAGALDYLIKDADLLDDLSDYVKKALVNVGLRRELEKTQRLVDEERKKYKLLFDSANDAIFVHDITGGIPGRFIDVNGIACARLGYTREELLGLDPQKIAARQLGEHGRNVAAILLRDGRATFEMTHQTRDGREVPVEISSRVVEYQDGKMLISMARDITERVRTEEGLRRQAEELRARNEELTRFNRVAIGRELRMIELKREVNELCAKLGEPPRHRLAKDGAPSGPGPEPEVRP